MGARADLESSKPREPEQVSDGRPPPYREAMLNAKRRYLTELLAACGGNIPLAARVAGLNRTALHRLLVKTGINQSQSRIRGNAAWHALGS